MFASKLIFSRFLSSTKSVVKYTPSVDAVIAENWRNTIHFRSKSWILYFPKELKKSG